jgi:hypothetical protein
MNESFIKQTAQDYDMSVYEVERIYNQYPNDFYQKLEEFILNRSKKK